LTSLLTLKEKRARPARVRSIVTPKCKTQNAHATAVTFHQGGFDARV
jgi:hypothetical protein